MLSNYRQHFAEYHSDLQREDYLFRSGRSHSRDLSHIYSEYSDLFRLSTVDELRAKLEDTAGYRKTERTSIQRLIAFALEGNLAARVQDISSEIESYEAAAKIDWATKIDSDEPRIAFSQSHELLAVESDRKRRRNLHARRSDAIKGSEDLMAERFYKMHNGAREIGFESYTVMRSGLRGVDFDKLTNQAGKILEKTESRYVSALAPMLMREADVSVDEATAADLPYLQRYSRFDAFFTHQQMPRMYRELFSNLGFNTELQSNVEVDSAIRTGKQSQAFCAPIRVPDEIKLVVNFSGGQANYSEFLREAGHAQTAAWTSRSLYPEFQIGGDAGVATGWGMLFENLLLDQWWLMGTFGFVESAEFRRSLAVLRLMELRRQAAKLIYETEFHAEKLSNTAGQRYSELMTDAVRVQFDGAECLREVSDDFRPADYLRAAAFEAQMRDHLKTKFGSRWWASAKAGEMLIDLWNTGQRYSVEELAAMIGLGELDFECLGATLLTQIA